MICAVIRGRIQQLNRLVDDVSKLHHAREKLRASATALRTIVHFELDQTRIRLRLLVHRVPLRCDRLNNEVTRFLRAPKGDVELAAVFIYNPTRHILLLAAHIVITGSMVTSGEPPTGKLPDLHGRFPIDTPAFDAFR